MKKADFWLIAVVFAAALVCWGAFVLFGTGGATVTVKEKNETVYQGALHTDKTVTLSGNTVVIRDGKVSVSNATCRNQLCVHHRPIARKGETILCLPHQVAVLIE
ncbi:MAG: NusG domain II-containing protein [Clostridia bacterium]|nr:NusG domain II-containing protein [Clostridia bacterium]